MLVRVQPGWWHTGAVCTYPSKEVAHEVKMNNPATIKRIFFIVLGFNCILINREEFKLLLNLI